ncbi:unnamed protein product [Cuscuta epithymum]|uniref:Uncharacterized protein n=1 Tax=Cuscuta epithymum TaxID=186058 RepID=A0AAV0D355_9ASTE|nr:unnamed protein product [Cuscuta epithymum]
MNPTAADPTQPPPVPPSQPPRSSFSCDHHPDEKFSGFCPECLRQRLTTLDQSSSNNNPSTSRRNSTSSAAAAIKSLFSKPSTSSASHLPPPPASKSSRPSTFIPELRRTKSLSASKNESLSLSAAAASAAVEPQRRSCDVRGRNTIFSVEEGFKPRGSQNPHSKAIAEAINGSQEAEHSQHSGNDQEITDLQETQAENPVRAGPDYWEIAGEEGVEGDILNKPMKDHIDLDSQTKKPSSSSSLAGSILSTALLSKKWQKWRKKQKLKKQESSNNGKSYAAFPVEKSVSKKHNAEIQPEMADYGFGRRSCDTDPRFSLDVSRISFDGPRYSLDEPRASCDGYLNGRTIPFPRTMAPMVSVVEDDAPFVHVPRADTQIPVLDEDSASSVMMNSTSSDEKYVPGGSAQTRDYYLDSSTRRRKSLDRSTSIRKTAAAVVAEIDDIKTAHSFHRSKGPLTGEKDSLTHSNSMRDDVSETFELTSSKDSSSMIGGADGTKKGMKKSKKWAWNIFGFIYRRGGGNKDDDNDDTRYRSWQDQQGDSRNGSGGAGANRKLFRSNSSVSWRDSTNNLGAFEAARKSSAEMNSGNGKVRKDEFVFGRNRSACYYTNRFENGLKPVLT